MDDCRVYKRTDSEFDVEPDILLYADWFYYQFAVYHGHHEDSENLYATLLRNGYFSEPFCLFLYLSRNYAPCDKYLRHMEHTSADQKNSAKRNVYKGVIIMFFLTMSQILIFYIILLLILWLSCRKLKLGAIKFVIYAQAYCTSCFWSRAPCSQSLLEIFIRIWHFPKQRSETCS